MREPVEFTPEKIIQFCENLQGSLLKALENGEKIEMDIEYGYIEPATRIPFEDAVYTGTRFNIQIGWVKKKDSING